MRLHRSTRPVIFVSYRREDPGRIKAGLCDRLARLLPHCDVFRDQDDLIPGSPYPSALLSALRRARLVLVLVDDVWHSRWDRNPAGEIIDNPEDWVFRELEIAVHENIQVLPVIISPAGPLAFPADDPKRATVPPALRELAFVQNVQFFPEPDFNVSAKNIADTIERLIRPPAQITRRTVLAATGMAALAPFVWWWSRPDETLAHEQFLRDVESIRAGRPQYFQDRSQATATVKSLGDPDYSSFTIHSDERIWDLRGFRKIDPESKPMQSAVYQTRYVRVSKIADAEEIRFEGRTSGSELFLRCLSHPDRSAEIVSNSMGAVGQQFLRVRQLAIDVSEIQVGSSMNFELASTTWDSLQSDADLWVGAIGYPGARFVRMTIIFPEDRPFKTYHLERAPKGSREAPTLYQGRRVCFVTNDRRAVRWEIPEPQPNFVYRLSWTW